jgi:hypothetical protein
MLNGLIRLMVLCHMSEHGSEALASVICVEFLD